MLGFKSQNVIWACFVDSKVVLEKGSIWLFFGERSENTNSATTQKLQIKMGPTHEVSREMEKGTHWMMKIAKNVRIYGYLRVKIKEIFIF